MLPSGPNLEELRQQVADLQQQLAVAAASLRRATALCDSASDGLCQLDQDLHFQYVNAAAERFLGHARADLLGRALHDTAVPEAFTAGVAAAVQRPAGNSTSPERFDFEGAGQTGRVTASVVPETVAGALTCISIGLRESDAPCGAGSQLARAGGEVARILDGMQEDFAILDTSFRFTWVNKPLFTNSGHTRDQLIGACIWDVFPHLVSTALHEQLQRSMHYRTAVLFTAELMPGRWWDVYAYPTQEGLCYFGAEITGRKRAEDALRETSQTLSAVIHASPLPIIAVRQDGVVTLWNDAAEQVFGWIRDEVLGRPVPFLDGRELSAICGTDPSAIRTFEIRTYSRDGREMLLALSSAGMRASGAGLPVAVVLCQDVTEQRRVEAELREKERVIRESEESLRAATESAQVGVWVYDGNDDRLMFSPLSARLLGLPPGEREMTIRNFLAWIHEEDRDRTRGAIRRALQSSHQYETEYRVRWPDGTLHWIAARGLATDEHGLGQRFSGVVTEITERKRVEAELEAQRQELARSNADLQQFAFVTSHDLQEPLRNIASYARLLLQRNAAQLDDGGREFLGYITDGCLRMQRMINDLLAFSRVLHGGDQAFAPVNLDATFSWAVMNLNTAINETGAVITSDTLPQVRGNESELVQLLQNLIGNAIKYRSAEPPRIHVGVEERASEYLFSVRDNGIGIAPAFHDQIFGIFRRLHGREIPGTGIGLALCRRIVEKHGGTIHVQSQPGHGSTFWFTLPRS